MRERIYKTLIQRYTSQMEEALLKVDMLLSNNANAAVIVGHTDITGEIDKLLSEAAKASEKREKYQKFIEDPVKQANYLESKYGPGPEPDDYASGGIARMLGE